MPCCSSESNGCSVPKPAESLSQPSFSSSTPPSSIQGSTRSSALKQPDATGTSTVLAMLPAGKACCNAPSSGLGGGGCEDTANNNANVNNSSNVLLQYTLNDLDRRAESNFLLGLICLGVCAMNVVLVYLNWCMHRADPSPKVSHRVFHLLEFWSSCVYAITETFALVMSPKTMLHIYKKPNLLKLLLFFNVVNSMVPAVLMTLDYRYFEIMCHEMEFVNSFTLSFITMILIASLLNPPSVDEENNWSLPPQAESEKTDHGSIVMGIVACVVAASNFIIYNTGYHGPAHYLEFTFNIIISLVTFWFCMDNRFVAQMEIGQILYGRHENCIFCQIRGNEMEEQMKTNARVQFMFGDNSETNLNGTNGTLPFDEELQQSESTPLINGSSRSSNRAGVIAIASNGHFREITEQQPLVAVYMHADWCKSSKQCLPVFSSLAQKLASSAIFCTMDVDEVEGIAEAYNVQSTPTVVVFQNNQVKGTHLGSPSHDLEAFLKTTLTQ